MKYYKYGLMGAVLTLTFDLVVCSVSMIYGQETPSSNGLQELQSQITELKQKTNRLEAKAQANNTVDYGNEALKQGIALIGIAGATGFAAWSFLKTSNRGTSGFSINRVWICSIRSSKPQLLLSGSCFLKPNGF